MARRAEGVVAVIVGLRGRRGGGERCALLHGYARGMSYPEFKIAVPFATVARTCSPHSHAGQRESEKGTAWPGGREGGWEGEGGPRTARQAAKWGCLCASVSRVCTPE
jgi:hypothetical protein